MRPDGTRVKNASAIVSALPYIMPRRYDAHDYITDSAELDAEVVAATKAAGYDNLKGHKSVGGLRASVYNAMPIEGAQALVDFLKKFEAEHK